EVVIDSINLVLVEYFGNRVVDVAGAPQVASDRLLDDQPRERTRIARGLVPRRNEPGTIQLTHCRYEKRRRHGQVVDAIARQTALVLDDVEPRTERCERA